MRTALSLTATWLLAVGSVLPVRTQAAMPVAPAAAPDAARPASPTENPRFKATLLLLEADWSKIATAKEIERDLQAALKDVPLPDNLRQNVAAAGPLILFAPEHVHVYRPQDWSDLLVWLTRHGLIKKRIEYTVTDTTTDDEAAISVDLKELPMDVPLPPPPPFVSRRVQWRWSFSPFRRMPADESLMGAATPDPAEAMLAVRQRLVVFEDYAGQQKRTEQRADMLNYVFDLSFPKDRVATVHAFPDRWGERMRNSTRAAGVEAVLVVSDSSLSIPALEGRAERPGAVRTAELIRRVGPVISRRPSRRPPDGPPTDAAASAAKTAPASETELVKVFSLMHLEANTAVNIISRLYRDTGPAMAAEERTNALIVRGDAAKLAEVEALLLRLDSEPAGGTPPGPAADLRGAGAAGHTRPTSADPDWRAAKYRELEEQAARTATEYRHVRQSAGATGPQLPELKNRLRQEVAAAFAARQDWQQAELNQLRARLAAIDLSLNARERIKDTIIDRRVAELLNPDIVWDFEEQPGELPRPEGRASARPGSSDAPRAQAPETREQAPAQAASPAVAGQPPAGTPGVKLEIRRAERPSAAGLKKPWSRARVTRSTCISRPTSPSRILPRPGLRKTASAGPRSRSCSRRRARRRWPSSPNSIGTSRWPSWSTARSSARTS